MSLTRSKVKSRPSMYAAPPNIACRTVGAISSSSSRKMAIESGVPAILAVSSPNFLVPSGLNSMFMMGSPVPWCWPG